jgi:hypothetical protein
MRFTEGKGDVEDYKWSGCPLMKTDENVGNVRTTVRTDCHLDISRMAEVVTRDKEMVRQILTTDLNMKKVCMKVAPKNVSEDQKLATKCICSEI